MFLLFTEENPFYWTNYVERRRFPVDIFPSPWIMVHNHARHAPRPSKAWPAAKGWVIIISQKRWQLAKLDGKYSQKTANESCWVANCRGVDVFTGERKGTRTNLIDKKPVRVDRIRSKPSVLGLWVGTRRINILRVWLLDAITYWHY